MVKSKSITSLPKSSCTGCKMCGDVCPKHCISFKEDIEGFFYPTVDESRCVDCGLCAKNVLLLTFVLMKSQIMHTRHLLRINAKRIQGHQEEYFRYLLLVLSMMEV